MRPAHAAASAARQRQGYDHNLPAEGPPMAQRARHLTRRRLLHAARARREVT